ncbi:MAG TPA: hypothetical protein VKJ07_05800, partial [Mycobacteriales bacterium]|nr:hypothetical protein [Mycobacteriales bacterium]
PPGATCPITSFDYTNAPTSASGGSTAITDPNSHSSTYTYDNRDRVFKVTDPLGRVESGKFDTDTSGGVNDDDNFGQTTNVGSGISDASFNSGNSLVQVQGPVNGGGQRATESWSYADSGHPFYPTAYTNAQGSIWNYGYDSAGNLCAKSEGTASSPLTCSGGSGQGANMVKVGHNPDGTVKQITDAKGTGNSSCPDTTATACYTYDSSSTLLTRITNPSPLGAEQFGWDSLRRLASTIDGKSQTTTYVYDGTTATSRDRLTTITYQGGATVGYGYDDNGNVLTRTDASGTTTYNYNRLNQLASEVKPGGATISYIYKPNGDLASITENSLTTSYGYDNADRLTSIQEPTSQGHPITYSYPDELHATIAYPGGASVASTYDG